MKNEPVILRYAQPRSGFRWGAEHWAILIAFVAFLGFILLVAGSFAYAVWKGIDC